MKVSSVKKKLKAKSFAPGVERDKIKKVWRRSMKATLGSKDVKEVTAGQRSIRMLYSKQRSFYGAPAPEGVERADGSG